MREWIIDSFAGGGGASSGIEMALGRSPDIAINHDPIAMAVHAANHPKTLLLSKNIWQVDPYSAVGNRPVGLLWASPDCKHFSKAKGGKPVKRNIRDLAWVVVRWAKQARPRVIILENVEEFRDWGPLKLHDDGELYPDPDRKGETFALWTGELRRLGYKVEHRELRACDYGAPTIRKRLFLIARRDGHAIVWPEPTHGDPKTEAVKSGKLKPWRTASEILDWSLPCPSIFLTPAEAKRIGVKRPLADATMARIARGVKRYVIDSPRPFIVRTDMASAAARNGVNAHDEPLRTQTTAGSHAVVEPYIVPVTHAGDTRVNPVSEPLRTQTAAHRGEHAVVAPFVTKFRKHSTGHPVDEPLHTITANGQSAHPGGAVPLGVVAAVMVKNNFGEKPHYPVDEPVRTIVAGGQHHMLVAPVLAGCGGRAGQSPERPGDAPLGTLTAKADGILVAPVLAKVDSGQSASGLDCDVGLTEPDDGSLRDSPARPSAAAGFFVPRYGERDGQEPRAQSVETPLSTIVPDGNGAQLVAAHMMTMRNAAKPFNEADAPAHTITAGGASPAVVAAFLAQHNTGVVGHAADEPVSTIVQKGSTQAVVGAHLLNLKGSEGGARPADEPLATLTAMGKHAGAVAAFLSKYYGTGDGQPADDPLHTVTTKDRAALVTVTIDGEPYVIVDIGMRMLSARERFNAQGFPPDYIIDIELPDARRGTKRISGEAQGRLVGNSVCPPIAAALVAANCADMAADADEAEVA